MLKEFTIGFADLSDVAVILVAAASLLTVKRSVYFTLLSIYLFVLSAMNLAAMVTANYGMNNSYIYHFTGFAELIFVFLLYSKLGIRTPWFFAFVLVAAIYLSDSAYLVTHQLQEINSVGQSLAMLFIQLLGFNFLWKLYKDEKVERLNRYPQFYISAGLTFFASGAFFAYLLVARLSKESIPAENFYYSWLIISGFTFIKCFLIATGIYMERKYAK